MNRLVKLTFLLSLLFVMFQSCGGNDGPEAPTEEIRRYSSKDSVAFVEVMKAAYGEATEKVMARYGMDLDDMKTWGPENGRSDRPLHWHWYDDIKEYRIDNLAIEDMDYLGFEADDIDGYLSKHVWDMDSLVYLWVRGKNIHGDVPERHGACPSLVHMEISYTSISSIPDDLFNVPLSAFANVTNNEKLKTFPAGLLENIPLPYDDGAVMINMNDNGFEGTAPMETNQSVILKNNNFTQVDWERLKSVDFKEKLMYRVPLVPFCLENKISGKAPDWVLKDTLATIYTNYIVQNQENGFGVSNLPSPGEVEKMKKEYAEHHPEFKPYFTR